MEKTVTAYAWLCDFGLCKWAQPSKWQLERGSKPSPEAKAVRVYLSTVPPQKTPKLRTKP